MNSLNSEEVLRVFYAHVIFILEYFSRAVVFWFLNYSQFLLLIFREDGLTYKFDFRDCFWKLVSHLLGTLKESRCP